MRWLACRKKKWVILLMLILASAYFVRVVQFHSSSNPIYMKYLELFPPTSVLTLKYPLADKWDFEHVLGTFSEHRSIKRIFAYPATSAATCNDSTVPENKPCVDLTCDRMFYRQSEDNLKKVESYPSTGVDKIRQDMLHYLGAISLPAVSLKSIVIVSGSSSDFFFATQGLLRMLHKELLRRYANIHIIIYDLGLEPCQRTLMKKYCRCEVKDFPFQLFPSHVKDNLKSYAWKPLLIQLELMQHRYVTWMDSSIRLISHDFPIIYQQGINNGIMVAYGEFSLAQQTDIQMFQWFQEEPCLFSRYYEVQPGYIMVYRNSFTMEKIMRPWVACALHETCILPSSAVYECDNTIRKYGKCHRHDQSAISIILTRLYQRSRELLHLTRFRLRKRENVHYFPEEPSMFCWLW